MNKAKYLILIFLLISFVGIIIFGGGSKVAASPSDIDGLWMWFKADSLIGTYNNGDAVASWPSSSNSYTASQTIQERKPTFRTNQVNGQPAVQFDGSNDYLLISGDLNPDNATVFLVFKKQDPPLVQYMAELKVKNTGIFFELHANDENPAFSYGIRNQPRQYYSLDTSSDYVLISGTMNPGEEYTLRNNRADVSLQTGDNNGGIWVQNVIGNESFGDGNNGFKGFLAEYIVYDRILNSSEIESVENYLHEKYFIDTVAPVISNIASSTTVSTATVTWNTNEAATSSLYTGNSGIFGRAGSSDVPTTSHSFTVTGLATSTSYNFFVESTDASGNTSTSSVYVLRTATPDEGGRETSGDNGGGNSNNNGSRGGGGGGRKSSSGSSSTALGGPSCPIHNFKIGSTGPDVTALQDKLIQAGYLVIPAGVTKGYYGPVTDAAYARCLQRLAPNASINPNIVPSLDLFFIGKTGPDVVALQDILINAGFLVMPQGVAKGYYGNLTLAAHRRILGLGTTGITAPAVTPNPSALPLRVGSTGPLVVEVQSILERGGYLVMPQGVAKGYYGELTKKAIEKFQIFAQITPVTGLVDQNTLYKLRGN